MASATAAAESLPFTPALSATLGAADRPARVGGHPQFTTLVTQPANQARIKKAVVTLPPGLYANVAALNALCPVAQRDTGFCPAATKVGSVKAVSPWVPTTLTGTVFIAENPTGGLPGLVITLTGSAVYGVLLAETAFNGNRLETTLDNLPAAPVSSFELTIDGGPQGLFTVGNPLCDSPVTNSSFTSYSGQTVTGSAPVNIVGSCVPVPAPVSAFPTSKKSKSARAAHRAHARHAARALRART